ncbi:uncharacterized protein LOC131427106 [Malaya genurostris]|uniref:uncharacterized protein LOC131427106 n=1 Tax=Malaya genurostris TaxID=325434 RepID=UPI0026F400C4|nr:uncharacterized protein LOC131427106 [Malaya genurostris]
MSDAKFAIPKLSGTNWQTWKVRLEMLLYRENLWSVVSDDLPEEEERDEQWLSDDRKAKATIVLLLEDSQLPLVKRCVHARDAFVALRDYHAKTSRSVRVSLLKKLCAINLVEGGNLEEHLLVIEDLFDRLESAGMELDKDTKVCMLLRSLPTSFDSLVSALDSRPDDDVTLEVVKAKLADEYGRRLERDRRGCNSNSEKAMRTVVKKEARTCHFCKKAGTSAA